jgi:hypothetical protein
VTRLALTLLFLNFACQIADADTQSRGDWLLLGLCTITAALFLMHLFIRPPHALQRTRI